MHMRIIKSIGIISLFVLLGIGIFFYLRVNSKYPQKEYREYKVGDEIDYQSYCFCVTDAQMYRFMDFKDRYHYIDDIGQTKLVGKYDTNVLVMSMRITNPTDRELPMPPIVYFTLEGKEDAYSTNCDMYIYGSLYNYDYSLLQDPIPPGGSVEVLIPFSIDAVFLSIYDGNVLNVKDFIYVISLYPTKNYISF